MIRAPYQVQRTQQVKTTDPLFVTMGYQRIQQTLDQLEALKAKHEREHQAELERIRKDHAASMAQIDTHVQRIANHMHVIQKGDPGTDGVSPPPADERAIENRVLSRIRQPKDGETPFINEDAIAQKVLKRIKLPTPKDGKSVNAKEIVDLVLEKITKDKVLKTTHIGDFTDGMEQTLRPIRSLAAGFRGGGDTVAAGSNVTITTVGGVKTISASSGAAVTPITMTGTIDDSNKSFTAASTPTLVNINGTFYRHGHGVTIAGTAVTTDSPVGTGGDIFGI